MKSRTKHAVVCALLAVAPIAAQAQLTFSISGSWPTQSSRDAYTAAAQAIFNDYNAYGNFGSRNIDIGYNSGVQTADSGYQTQIRIGGSYTDSLPRRVLQHETNHNLGSGTTSNWTNQFDGNSVWTGANMTALIKTFDGDSAVIKQAGVHFYGYGLNYDTEVTDINGAIGSETVYMRNIALEYAQRQDDGLGPAANPWSATSIQLTKSDALGTSAFNNWSVWNDNYFTHAGAAYSTGNFTLRTPLDTYNPGGATPNFTFAGDSLTINNTNGINGGLLYKGVGTTGRLTFQNLILDGGYVRHASSANDLFQLAGKMTVASSSTISAAQGNIKILASVAGTGTLNVLASSFSVTLASPASTYTGGLNVAGQIVLAEDANLRFAIGTNGVNNALAGAAQQVRLNGVFDIDLVNASRTVGNSWSLVTASNTTYGDAFSLNGFTFNAGQWISDRGYVYSQATGQLSYVGTPPPTVSFSNTGAVPQTITSNQNFPFQRTTFFTGAGGGDLVVSGNISGVGGVAKAGAGTLTLAGGNTFTGGTRVDAGTLSLTGSLASGSALVLAGGTFTNARAGSATQTLNGLNVLAGASTVNNNSVGTLALGAITRLTAGTVDFLPTSGAIATSAANTNGILGPWAFVGTGANARFATNGSGTIAGYTAGTASATFGYASSGTANYEVSDLGGPFGSGRDANTVRYTGAAGAVTTNSTQAYTFNGLLNAGTGALTLGGGSFSLTTAAGSTGELVLAAANAGLTIAGPVIDGAGGTAVTVVGPNTVTLAGANTYTGKTTVSGGTLVVSGGASIADTGAVELGPDGNVTFSTNETIGSLAGRGAVNIAGITLTVGAANASTTFRGDISGAGGALTKTRTGTLFLWGSNTYTGNTTINSGTLSVSSVANNLGAGSVLNLGSGAGVGTLQYTGTGETSSKSIFQSAGAGPNGGTIDMSGTGLLRFTGATLGANASQPHTLTLQGSTSGSGQIDGVISDGSASNKTSLLKQGTGTWILAGGNTYTGPTTVNGGVLLVSGNASAASGNWAVNSGGTLGGLGTIGGTTTIGSGGALSPGNAGNGSGVLAFSKSGSALTLLAGSVSTFEIGGTVRGAQYDGIDLSSPTGALTYGGGLIATFTAAVADGSTFDLFQFSALPAGAFDSVTIGGLYNALLSNNAGTWTGSDANHVYTFRQSTGDLAVLPVPEPASLALLGFAMVLGAWGARRSRRQQVL